MKANGITLKDILDGQYVYQVPLFQRPYSWKRSNWESLWEDLIDLYSNEESESHFLGSFVTQDIQSLLGKVSSYIVIDGQQRLTTISILLASLRDFVDSDEYKSKEGEHKSKSIFDEIHDLLTNRRGGDESYLKISPTQSDYEAYLDIISHKESCDKEGSIYDAYRLFYKNIKDLFVNPEQSLDIDTFVTIIQNKVELVHISLGEKDNPSLIYESLNYKGQPLSQADLIRNYFFMEIPKEMRKKIHEDYWLSLELRFKKLDNAGDNYLVEMTNAFWYYLRKDGKAVNYKSTFSALKDKVEKAKKLNQSDSSKHKGDKTEVVLAEFKEMCKFAEYYLRINFPGEEPNPTLQKLFTSWSELNYRSVYPFLLNVYDDCMENKISLKEIEEIINILESFLIRRWFVDIASGGLNKTFISLYTKLTNPKDKDSQQPSIVTPNMLRLALREGERIFLWPEDEKFKKFILERPIYAETKDNRRRIKFVFQRIQEKMSKETVCFKDLNIEHILPQKLSEEWKKALGDKSQEQHKQWSDTLGNLTIVHQDDNSTMSNKGFVEKLNFLKNSNLSINSYFRDKNSWGIPEIQERGKHLAELACEIWSR